MSYLSRKFLNSRGILSAVRNVQTSSALFENSKNKSSINPFYFNMCGYNKYGLLHDDLLNFEDPDVKEAVRRLPEQMKMERAYRAIQAFQVELHHDVLPKDKWTKPDDDHYYLQPYLEEVIAEREEREEWDSKY